MKFILLSLYITFAFNTMTWAQQEVDRDSPAYWKDKWNKINHWDKEDAYNRQTQTDKGTEQNKGAESNQGVAWDRGGQQDGKVWTDKGIHYTSVGWNDYRSTAFVSPSHPTPVYPPDLNPGYPPNPTGLPAYPPAYPPAGGFPPSAGNLPPAGGFPPPAGNLPPAGSFPPPAGNLPPAYPPVYPPIATPSAYRPIVSGTSTKTMTQLYTIIQAPTSPLNGPPPENKSSIRAASLYMTVATIVFVTISII